MSFINEEVTNWTHAFSATGAVPTATQNGDTLVAIVQARGAEATTDFVSPPSGWTEVRRHEGETPLFAMFLRTADNEPENYTWTFDGSVGAESIAIYRLAGGWTIGTDFSERQGGGGTNVTGVTTTEDGAVAVTWYACNSGSPTISGTTPDGWLGQVLDKSGTASTDLIAGHAAYNQTTAGDVPEAGWTQAVNTSIPKRAGMVAFHPVSAPDPDPDPSIALDYEEYAPGEPLSGTYANFETTPTGTVTLTDSENNVITDSTTIDSGASTFTGPTLFSPPAAGVSVQGLVPGAITVELE